MRDLNSAVLYAKSQVGRNAMHGLCQGLSRTTVGVPAFGRSASVAWELCRDRGWGVRVDAKTIIPAGSIVYYSSRAGFAGHDPTVGHATFCVKSGTIETAIVVSNDVGPAKQIGAVHPKWFKDHWHMQVRGYIVRCPFGKLPIEGGAAHVSGNGSKPDAKDDDGPVVNLANLRVGASNADVVTLQKALIKHGFNIPAGPTGNYRDQTVAAVKAAQHKQGFSGKDADGAVGRKTCLFLGLTLAGARDLDLDMGDVPRELLPELVGVSAENQGEFWSEAKDAAGDDTEAHPPGDA